jgi:hypothetical protein
VNGWALNFNEKIIYPHNKQGINLTIVLQRGNEPPISIETKLDTGSTFCIFQPQYAELLGLEIEKGEPEIVRAATEKFIVYGHELTLKVVNLEWEATVYFVLDKLFPVSVLGRISFLDRLKIGLVDYEQLLYLSSYND